MAAPRAGSSELKGSAPAGEDRVIRETCWARRVGVTETCTRETRRQVTELTETREVEVRDVHTHTKVARDNGGELAERVETRCEQLGSLPREQGEGVYAPLRPVATRWIRSCRAR